MELITKVIKEEIITIVSICSCLYVLLDVLLDETNDSKLVIDFTRKSILTRFGTSYAIISDKESHFNNK